MTGRQSGRRKILAASASLVLLVCTWHAGPAFAASDTLAMCDDVNDVTLDIPAEELQATINGDTLIDAEAVDAVVPATEIDTVSATEKRLPSSDAIPHKVLKESTTRFSQSDRQPTMNASVPGVSDDELARYKRQMYRTDI